ncbi:HNH endonuclease [Chitinophaga flava]|uniref:Uncharacterized protein n=1 Tax=Chitinophaga flava TaxID=2259036 RepID=A0A365Y4B1_9BACT|nr:HNH endonuclease [Chitinophaga flava]RBL93339.1 hypothetical protein DF182_12500 [Chitinophaga flava]
MPLKKEYIESHIQKYSPSLVSLGYLEPKYGWGTDDGKEIYRFKNFNKLYICPLCAKRVVYRDEDFNSFTNEHGLIYEFTKDHYPPKSVGGSTTMMICKQCNNDFGGSIDHSIEKYLYSKALANGSSIIEYPATLTLEGLPGFVSIHTRLISKNQIQFIVPKNNKRVIEFIAKAIEANSSDNTTFTLRLKKPPEDAIFCRAILKTAFMQCFSTWGYDFVFSPTGERMREIIAGQQNHPSKKYGIYFLDRNYIQDEGIYSFKVNKTVTFYLVVIKLKLIKYNIDHEFVGAIIPENTEEAWRYISKLPLIEQEVSITTPLYKVPNYIDQMNYFAFKGENRMYYHLD